MFAVYSCEILQLCCSSGVFKMCYYGWIQASRWEYEVLPHIVFAFLELGRGVRRRFLRVSSGSKKQRSKPVVVAKSSSPGLDPHF